MRQYGKNLQQSNANKYKGDDFVHELCNAPVKRFGRNMEAELQRSPLLTTPHRNKKSALNTVC